MMPFDPCFGYIDPGTMSNVFSSLTPILAALAAVVGFLLWPFRFVLYRARERYRTFSRTSQFAVWAVLSLVLLVSSAGVFALVTH